MVSAAAAGDAVAKSGAAVTFVVDPQRCRRCARDPVGLRCDQCLTPGYEQQLLRSRALQQRGAAEARPKAAPCGDACPLSLCIQGYSSHIAAGEYGPALGHIMVRNPLPEAVCRVCDRPCEKVCVRASMDEAVAVNDLKRFVVAWADAKEQSPWRPPAEARHGRRVAVVGAGPCGLSASHDLAARGYEVTLYDAAERPGGVLSQCIPTYRLPVAALERDIARTLALGVTFVPGRRLGPDLGLDGLLAEGFVAVVVATGAATARTLTIPGMDAIGSPPVETALAYLRKVRAAATADDTLGPPAAAAGERLGGSATGSCLVIGGGNSAIDTARSLLRRGTGRVALACIEARDAMPALPEEIAAAEAEGVQIQAGLTPVRMEPGSVVFALADDASHRSAAANEVRIETDRVLVAIGQDPDPAVIDALRVDGRPLARGNDGALTVDPESGVTDHPAVYAGGDLVPGRRTVTSAMAAGLRIAWAIDRADRGALADVRLPPLHPSLEPATWRGVRTRHVARRHPPELEPRQRRQHFGEVNQVLSEAEARAEASRCLVCGLCGNCSVCIDLFGCPALTVNKGRVVIDPMLCNGCGVCAAICPNDAIVPVAATPEEAR